ncbi:MAG TPA: DRTGG domain-containing protein [Armatimonadota bacterium]
MTIVEGEQLTPARSPDREIGQAAAADLMSDVLAFAKPNCLLITGLANAQAVRTAELADVAAIVLVRGKRPEVDALALARERGIPMVASPCTMFDMCGRLYVAGLVGCDTEPRTKLV